MPDSVPFTHPWDEDFIGNKADVIVGGTPDTTVTRYWGGSIPWMSSGDVHLRRIHEVSGRITEAGLLFSAAKLVEPPSVAVALAGQGKTRGTVALSYSRLCTNQSVALIKPRDRDVDASYLFHALDYRYEELRARSAGGGRAGLTKHIVEKIPVPLPGPTEQSRIAEILDTLDATIWEAEAALAKLRQVKDGLIHDLLTRGLDEHGCLRDPIRHSEQFQDSPHGTIPKEWAACKLGELFDSTEYGISSAVHNEGRLPVLRMNNLNEGEADLSEIKFINAPVPSTLLLRVGDVLFNRTNSMEHVGRTGIWRGQLESATYASYLVRLNPNTKRLVGEYLNLLLNRPAVQTTMRRFATPGVHQVNINPTNLRRLTVAVPSTTHEQVAIVERIQEMNARLSSSLTAKTKLQSLKCGLAHDLLTGNVRVKI